MKGLLFWLKLLLSGGRPVPDALKPGQALPEFTATDEDGRQVSSLDLRGAPAVILFVRGNWCPFCMAQVREIMERYRELADLGAEIVLVSPQATELTQRVADLFEVPCRFWVDASLEAAGELGIRHGDGVPAGPLAKQYGKDTVYPTVIVTDEDGKILFADQTDNYRVRPEPAVFLRVLQAHGFKPAAGAAGH